MSDSARARTTGPVTTRNARFESTVILPHDGTVVSLAVTAQFRSDDPEAIHLLVGETDWSLARSLLEDVLALEATTAVPDPVGEGDVVLHRVVDREDQLMAHLSSPDGDAWVELRTAKVRDVLRRSEELHRAGRRAQLENIDAELAAILG